MPSVLPCLGQRLRRSKTNPPLPDLAWQVRESETIITEPSGPGMITLLRFEANPALYIFFISPPLSKSSSSASPKSWLSLKIWSFPYNFFLHSPVSEQSSFLLFMNDPHSSLWDQPPPAPVHPRPPPPPPRHETPDPPAQRAGKVAAVAAVAAAVEAQAKGGEGGAGEREKGEEYIKHEPILDRHKKIAF